MSSVQGAQRKGRRIERGWRLTAIRTSRTFVWKLLLASIGLGAGGWVSVAGAGEKVVDLTHALHAGMAYWPGGVPFGMERLVDYDRGYRLHRFTMGENTGTHVDAPSHFIPQGRDIDDLEPSQLVAPLVVIGVEARSRANPDYRLSAADIDAWEMEHGEIPPGCFVALNTGWHRKFDDPKSYLNQDARDVMHFPGYSVEAAKILLKRDVAGIGIDTLSIDPGDSQDFAAHKVVLGAGRYMVENLANLDVLPATGATIIVGVLPVRGGSQAQARVLALIGKAE
ncbi:MAG: cyclase family protein [Gammaproteobacteria bacterium]|nr:cyclase family protein [Gammaproteobacteria bacterium]